ncbi:hypothetical protein FRC02_006105 [Tulasnella sp. 418]|nr:hypothetical protein FRC02_006105 [Tulasnella sp. 418]
MSATVVGDTAELIGLIVEQLWIAEWPSTSTLATCMRVNYLFNQETLRYLWYSLKDLSAIYALLPLDLVRSRDPVNSPEIYGAILPSEWERLERHTRLVKELSICTEIDRKLLTLHMDGSPDHPLFPNLVALFLEIGCDNRTLVSLLSPSLKRLKLPLRISPTASLLDALRSIRLTELRIRSHIAGTAPLELEFLKSVIQAKLKTLELRSFILSETHFHLINSLSEIENLKILSCGFDATLEDTIVPPQGFFPKLSSLMLGTRFPEYEAIVCDLGIQPQDSLNIHHYERMVPLPEYERRLTDILSSLNDFRTFSLKSFSLRGHALILALPNLRGSSTSRLSPTVISPLLKFTHLEEFRLDTDPPIDFADEDIELVVKTLPNLVHVTIGMTTKSSFWYCGTRLTPNSLNLFAMFSSRLRDLSINVGTQWSALSNIGFSFSSSQLTSLQLNHSRMSVAVHDIGRIASILETLFPVLQDVGFDEARGSRAKYEITPEEIDARRRIKENFRGRKEGIEMRHLYE